jgi:hypothetical protein
MRLRLLLIALVLLPALTVRAQDDAPLQYRLRVSTQEEYLAAIPHVVDIFREKAGAIYAPGYDALLTIIHRELTERYPDFLEADYPLVSQAMARLELNYYYIFPALFGDNINDYYMMLLESILNNIDVDLATADSLNFGQFDIVIDHIDFSGDGVDELLLDISYNDGIYRAFKVVKQDSSQPSGYLVVDIPGLWFDQSCGRGQVCSGQAQRFALDDFNADGLVEIAIAVGAYCGYGDCAGHLEILGWRDGKMRSINPIGPSDIGWRYSSFPENLPILPRLGHGVLKM